VDFYFVACEVSINSIRVECAWGRIPVTVFLEHSTAFSIWMSNGLSRAETPVSRRPRLTMVDEKRMLSSWSSCSSGEQRL